MAFTYSISSLMVLLPFALIFSFDVAIALPQQNIVLTEFTKLNLPPNVAAFGSLAFDLSGGGPYVGTADGRVLQFFALTNSWHKFSYTSPNRTDAFCDGTNGFSKQPTCGFPSGLSHGYLGRTFFAVDGFYGLQILNAILEGKPTILVPSTAAVPPMKDPNTIDAAGNGMVYFTDASAVYGPEDILESIETRDSTGRLFQYNPVTGQVAVLGAQLGRPIGVATDIHASFVLVSEVNKNQIRKFELTGANSSVSRVLLTFEGMPNKISRNQEGNFWTAVDIVNTTSGGFKQTGVKFSPSGTIVATVDFSKNYNPDQYVSVVVQHGQELFVVAYNVTFVGKYKIA